MIKLHQGTSRTVFIFFNFLVVKIPHLHWGIIQRKVRQQEKFSSRLRVVLHEAYLHLIHGIASNISEGLIYAVVGKNATHLTPIFTFGLFNISVYEGSKRPTPVEIESFYDSLSDESKVMLNKCDSHSKAPGNWRKTCRGLKLSDYGADPLTTPWALFIFCHNQELNDVAVKYIDTLPSKY